MKKILFFLLALIIVVIAALAFLPSFFKDDIKQAIDEQVAASVNAEVYFDADKFDISLLRSFPDLSISLADFGVANYAPFEGDTLLHVDRFALTVDLSSIIFGNTILIEEIALQNPRIRVKVLEDGKANYDIAKESQPATPSEKQESSGNLNIQVNRWSISNASVLYDDRSLPTTVIINGLEHSGSGDFTLDVFDMKTFTEIADFSMAYGGVEYLSNKKVTADVTLNMNLPEMAFTFKENKLTINELGLGIEGTIKMPKDPIDIDLSFGLKESDFKSLVSLVPGAYTKDFADVTAAGQFAFAGKVKGVYDGAKETMPGYQVEMTVKNGMFQYPGMPAKAENISLDLLVDSPDGSTDKLVLDLKEFALQLAGNPFKAKAHLEGLDRYLVDVDGKVDLAAIKKIIPMPDTELRGTIVAKIESKGSMKALEQKKASGVIASGSMTVKEMAYKSKDFPQGIEISDALVKLTPTEIILDKYQGKVGKSDMQLTGKVGNYLGYAFSPDQVLSGNLVMRSTSFDVNEWMPTEEASPSAPADTTTMAPVIIPKNLDFQVMASIDKMTYTNMTMNNLSGKITIKDGIADLSKLRMETLGGSIATSGKYDTSNPEKPTFNMGLDIKGLSFRQSYNTFNTVQTFAPLAQNVAGSFSSDFSLSGIMGNGMMPDLSALAGSGTILTQSAALQGVTALNKLSELTNFSALKDPKLTDILMYAEIKDGKLNIKPFDVTIGGVKMQVGGTTSLTGDLDYVVTMDTQNLPVSQQLKQFEQITFGIKGGYNSPKIDLMMNEAIAKKKEELINQGKEKLTDVVGSFLGGNKTDSTGQDSTKKQLPSADKVKDAVKGLFNKKKN